MSVPGTSETTQADPAMSAWQGQSGHTAKIVGGPSLTDAVEKRFCGHLRARSIQDQSRVRNIDSRAQPIWVRSAIDDRSNPRVDGVEPLRSEERRVGKEE